MEKLARILFPFKHVCGSVWKNDEGQLSFLRFVVCASPEVFTFCTFISNLNSFYQETSLGRESKASNLTQFDPERNSATENLPISLKQFDKFFQETSLAWEREPSNLQHFKQEPSLAKERKPSNLKQIDQETSVETERNPVDLKQDDRRCMECSEPITDDDKALPFELPLCGPIHTRCLHKFSF
jgi:hypothetical protein